MKEISSYFEMTENNHDKSIKSGIGSVCPQKEKIIDYFKKYDSEYTVLTCSASDYISGITLNESKKCFSDGKYLWTNEEVYHFKKYDLKLNDDFIQYVLNETA